MSNNENIQGAPTHGLNQSVSFQAELPRTPQTDAIGAHLLRAGVQGGGVQNAGGTQGQGVTMQQDPTLRFLFKAAENAVRPHIDAMQTDRYFRGMQSAMEGKAIQDIARDEPWYANVFGQADAVEGARSYYSHAKVQTLAAGAEAGMAKAREMEPPAAQEYFNGLIKDNLTGDKVADLSILKSAQSILPSLMVRQTKEHIAWRQERASDAFGQSFTAGVKLLQGAADGLVKGTVTQEELAGRKLNFVSNNGVPPAGMNTDTFFKTITMGTINAAKEGNLHAVSAMQELGLLDTLPADHQDRINAAVSAGESKLRTQYSATWAKDLAELDIQSVLPSPGSKPEDLHAAQAAMNKRFRDTTGASGDLISGTEMRARMTRSATSIAAARKEGLMNAAKLEERALNEADKATKLRMKEQADQDIKESILSNFHRGDLYLVEGTPGIAKERSDSIVREHYLTLPPEQRAALLVRNYDQGGAVVGTIRNELDGKVAMALHTGQGLTPEMQGVYKQYASLAEASPEAAAAYYPKYGAQLEVFHNAVKADPSMAVSAFSSAFSREPRGGSLPVKEKAALVKKVMGEFNPALGGLFGGTPLRADVASRFANSLEADAVKWAGVTGDPQAGMERAIKLKIKSGELESYGGHGWINPKGTRPLREYLTTQQAGGTALPKDDLDSLVGKAINEKLFNHTNGVVGDGKADTVLINRMADVGGEPRMHIVAQKDGEVFETMITGADIFKLHYSGLERVAAAKKAAAVVNVSAARKAQFEAQQRKHRQAVDAYRANPESGYNQP